MSQPWMKFYPRDWRGDQALRAVSIAARGLWMECLCVMHEASPYGHLVLNGAPVEAPILARMTGTTEEEVKALMAELAQAGVSSVTRGGVVFSRRMVTDFARANKGRKAVEKRYAQAAETNDENGTPSRSSSTKPTTQKPETRSQKPDIPSGYTSGAAPQPPPVALVPFIEIPTNRFETAGEQYPVYEPLIEDFQKLYPAVDVRAELRKMRGWSLSHPLKCKTRRGMKAFINGWLSRQQDKGSVTRETFGGHHGTGSPNRSQSGASTAHQRHLEGLALLVDEADRAAERDAESGELAVPTRLAG
jgi:hypothetical protein